MRNSEGEIKSRVFLTVLGWAGVALSGHGVVQVVLPKKDKKSVERQLGKMVFRDKNSGEAKGKKQEGLSLSKAENLLRKYFSGKPVVFDLSPDVRSYTDFQQAVWRVAMEIPFGETRSYGWIAKKIRRPLASRAVGQAMGANPVPIIIP